MKVSGSRRLLSGGIVFALVGFGVLNAALAMFAAPNPVQPVQLSSTAQIVTPADAPTAVTAATR